MKSDQGLRCPFTELMNSVEHVHINKQKKNRSYQTKLMYRLVWAFAVLTGLYFIISPAICAVYFYSCKPFPLSLWANSADDKLVIVFLFIPENTI